jgi:hypothetical protein
MVTIVTVTMRYLLIYGLNCILTDYKCQTKYAKCQHKNAFCRTKFYLQVKEHALCLCRKLLCKPSGSPTNLSFVQQNVI